MEGKETRFGVWASALFATSTTGTSTGAVNSFHDSFTPVGGGPAHLQHGARRGRARRDRIRVCTGCWCWPSSRCSSPGLMVGRTPEYLRKKITAREMKLVSVYILTMPVLVLAGTGLAMSLAGARESILNPGPHGLSEVLYAFMSAANNNGSAFAGISVNTDFYNTSLGLVMLRGPASADHLRARTGGVAGQAATRPGDRRHPADARPAVRRDAHRRRRRRGRPHLLPGPRTRSAGGGTVMTSDRALPSRSHAHPGRAAGSIDPADAAHLAARTPSRKLDPRVMAHNPVMFVVEAGAVLSTVLAVIAPRACSRGRSWSGCG